MDRLADDGLGASSEWPLPLEEDRNSHPPLPLPVPLLFFRMPPLPDPDLLADARRVGAGETPGAGLAATTESKSASSESCDKEALALPPSASSRPMSLRALPLADRLLAVLLSAVGMFSSVLAAPKVVCRVGTGQLLDMLCTNIIE